MSLNKINRFLGNVILWVGIAKIVYVIIIVFKFVFNVSTIASGGTADNEYYPGISAIIGLSQLIFTAISVVMIIINKIKDRNEVLLGYIGVIGALILELIIPSLFSIFTVFIVSSIYMKSGLHIQSYSLNYKKKDKKMKDATDWFYTERDK